MGSKSATPANRLDAAIEKLERQLKDRIEQPLRRLRQAVAHARAQGSLEEKTVLAELERIALRDRLDARAQHVEAANQIDHLAAKIMEEAK